MFTNGIFQISRSCYPRAECVCKLSQSVVRLVLCWAVQSMVDDFFSITCDFKTITQYSKWCQWVYHITIFVIIIHEMLSFFSKVTFIFYPDKAVISYSKNNCKHVNSVVWVCKKCSMHQCDLIKIRNYIQCQSTPLVLNSFNFMACRTHNAWIVYFGCIKHFKFPCMVQFSSIHPEKTVSLIKCTMLCTWWEISAIGLIRVIFRIAGKSGQFFSIINHLIMFTQVW